MRHWIHFNSFVRSACSCQCGVNECLIPCLQWTCPQRKTAYLCGTKLTVEAEITSKDKSSCSDMTFELRKTATVIGVAIRHPHTMKPTCERNASIRNLQNLPEERRRWWILPQVNPRKVKSTVFQVTSFPDPSGGRFHCAGWCPNI